MLNAGWSSLVPACRQAGLAPHSYDKMAYIIYVLKSERNGNLYIGFTSDLQRRVNEHNLGQNKSTKAFRPYKIVYTKIAYSRKEARIIEKKLKSGYLRDQLKKLK